jgi:hypothetical protein
MSGKHATLLSILFVLFNFLFRIVIEHVTSVQVMVQKSRVIFTILSTKIKVTNLYFEFIFYLHLYSITLYNESMSDISNYSLTN